MPEVKRATTYREQLELLKSRGAIVDDENFCLQKLSEINYYRLSAYFLPYRNEDGSYRPGTSFEEVCRSYEFDRQLRSLLFSGIEEAEIYLRTSFSYFFAHRYGPHGYLKAECFSPRHDHEKFLDHLDREIRSNATAACVRHHKEKYDGVFPIWAIVELFTFGMLSRFYNDMSTADKKALASDLYRTIPKNVSSWLRCTTDLRNICAHYGRLYNRIFPAIPSGFLLDDASQRRLWGAVLALKSLYPDAEKWNHHIVTRMDLLLEEFHDCIQLRYIGFPEDWAVQIRK